MIDETPNPDPLRYGPRSTFMLSPEIAQRLGIRESCWEPHEDPVVAAVLAGRSAADSADSADSAGSKAKTDPTAVYRAHLHRTPRLTMADVRRYTPLRLTFDLPPPGPGAEFTDAWFELLVQQLHDAAVDLCMSFFGQAMLLGARGGLLTRVPGAAQSPWATESFDDAFVQYCSAVAVQDPADVGGWDALLLDPRQRARVAQGVLAKLLQEHVFDDVLFGGTRTHKAQLRQADADTLGLDGYVRTVQRHRAVAAMVGEHVLPPCFWDDVELVAAQAARVLLPLLNLERRLLADALAAQAAQAASDLASDLAFAPQLGLGTFLQRLFDLVAVAGYASLSMARSASIFEFHFPLPGDLFDVDHVRDPACPVYATSVARASWVDAQRARAGLSAVLRMPKVKIVAWPLVARCKPRYTNDTVATATRTVLCKSVNTYYAGVVGGDDGPPLHEHVARVRRAWYWHHVVHHLARSLSFMVLLVLTVAVAVVVVGGRDRALQMVAEHLEVVQAWLVDAHVRAIRSAVPYAVAARSLAATVLDTYIPAMSAYISPVLATLPSRDEIAKRIGL